MYLMLSSDADLGLLGKLITEARLRARLVKERSIVIDNTHGPNAAEGKSIATDIFKALAAYLAPTNVPQTPP